MKLSQLFEDASTPRGRWIASLGPSRTPGFELQHERGSGWETVGFAKAKPESTVGSIEVYNGAKDKTLTVNLRNYTFGDEDAVA